MGYLMVMASPGRALMFQLQFSRAGYWKGHPGLVMTPLDARRSSATSPQAKERGRGQGQRDRVLMWPCVCVLLGVSLMLQPRPHR